MYIFPKISASQGSKYQLRQRSTYLLVNQEIIGKVLLYWSIKKALRPNIHNFYALYLVWAWDLIRLFFLYNKLSVFNITPNYKDMQKKFF